MKKRGQASTIILVLIIVMVLVIIVILWNVVVPLIEKTSGDIDIEIMTTDLNIEKASVYIDESAGLLQTFASGD